jgi:hypothetical protein
MTQTVTQVITRSLRMIGVLADGETPSSGEADDALSTFNLTQRGLFGDVIGVKLESETGATGNVRHGAMYQCGASAVTLTAPANPKDGWRFGISDAKGTINTNNVTVAPNGRKFKGVAASSTVLNTANLAETYFFRQDTGDWVLEADLTLTDNVYFPDHLIIGLSAMVAVNLAPDYNREVAASIVNLAGQGRLMFLQQYGRRGAARLGSPAAVAR